MGDFATFHDQRVSRVSHQTKGKCDRRSQLLGPGKLQQLEPGADAASRQALLW